MKTGMAMGMAIVAAMLAGVGGARAQAIFIDRFDGTRLRPHWQQPPPEHWEYTVGGGQLTVTDLFHPGNPGEPNTASIEAEFPGFGPDNQVLTTVLGWAPGEGRALTVSLWGPEGLEAAFGYDESGPDPLIFLHWPEAPPPEIQTAMAPGPGTHVFRLSYDHGDGISLFVDGVQRLGFGGATGGHVTRVEVAFSGAEGAAFSPLSVGLVRIVPSPGTTLVLMTVLGVSAGRRRR